MDSSKKSNLRLSVGGSSILVIFVIITLTTFATLSLVSANADRSLSLKTRNTTDQYYAADAKAEELLGEIDAKLSAAAGSPAFFDKAEVLLKEISGVTTLRDGDNLLAQFSVTINETQELIVELGINSNNSYTRRQWKVVSTVSQEEEDNLNLWSFE